MNEAFTPGNPATIGFVRSLANPHRAKRLVIKMNGRRILRSTTFGLVPVSLFSIEMGHVLRCKCRKIHIFVFLVVMHQLHINTPLLESPRIGKITGRQILVKMENVQPTGTFKIRGIGHLCQNAISKGIKHFISSSGGNAGYAVAYAGQKLNTTTTVFVPTTTPADTIRKIEELGAKVRIKGEVWDETHEHALEYSKEINGLYVHPFEHPLIWKGHSTIVDELVNQTGKPGVIILSVGGGGLLCGVMEGLHKNNWQDVPVITVETEGTASFAKSVQAGKLITLNKVTGVAKTLAAKTVSANTLEWNKKHQIIPAVVSDQDAISACINFANDHRCLVEPACGASLAIAYKHPEIIKKYRSVLIIVCGGIGVDLKLLKEWEK